MPTIVITGASRGIGKATVELFSSRGWKVIAAMRDSKKVDLRNFNNAKDKKNIIVLPLDLQDETSIANFAQKVLRYKPDVLLNNAGYGLYGPIETCTPSQIKAQYQTNIFGLITLTNLLLPQMRERRTGTIVNVSSILGRVSLPTTGIYSSTKHAVEGISEALSYELRGFGIRVKLIEPGAIDTGFHTSVSMGTRKIPAYKNVVRTINRAFQGINGSNPANVALMIWKAVHDPSERLRYPVGQLALPLLAARKILPDRMFRWIVAKRLDGLKN